MLKMCFGTRLGSQILFEMQTQQSTNQVGCWHGRAEIVGTHLLASGFFFGDVILSIEMGVEGVFIVLESMPMQHYVYNMKRKGDLEKNGLDSGCTLFAVALWSKGR